MQFCGEGIKAKMELQGIIDIMGLVPLPVEGGMFRQTYVSEVLYDGRPMGTAIYYLLSADAYSHLHLLDADEVYHFYLGDPVELYQLDNDGNLSLTILGQDIMSGQQVQTTVPEGVWQGSRLAAGGKWALLGTTMSPGYLDSGYTHADGAELAFRYPQHAEIIRSLTGEARFY